MILMMMIITIMIMMIKTILIIAVVIIINKALDQVIFPLDPPLLLAPGYIVCLCVCNIKSEYFLKYHYVCDPSNFDFLLHHNKVLLVQRSGFSLLGGWESSESPTLAKHLLVLLPPRKIPPNKFLFHHQRFILPPTK